MPQRAAARREFPPAEILQPLNGGLDVYTAPTLVPYSRWFTGTQNVFSGPFGFVQRSRFANIVTGAGTVSTAISNVTVSIGTPFTANITVASTAGFSVGGLITVSGIPTLANGTVVNGSLLAITNIAGSVISYTLPYPQGNGFAGLGGATSGTATTNGSAYTAQGAPFTTLKYYAIPGLSSYLIGDNNNRLFAFDSGNSYAVVPRYNPYIDPTGAGDPRMAGPWGRETIQNILYEMNGQVKQSGRGANAATIEGFGLDAPDVSPQVVISAGSSQTITNIQRTNGVVTVTLGGALTVPGGNGIGMVNVKITSGDTSFAGTFVVQTGSGTATLTWNQTGQNTALLTPTGTVDVNITKSVGRSYAYAWENANKPHVGAPSPSTQFIAYSAQNGAIQLIEQGTISSNAPPSAVITGVGTAFSQAWVGRRLWAVNAGSGFIGVIASVQSATQLTLTQQPGVLAGAQFQIYDPQSTHVRLYATADGGATYFRIQRNAFVPTSGSLVGAGLQFFDNANAEPPNFPFTTETSQLNNVPPPVGSFLAEYQGRLVVLGVAGALQSFFYSNSELTSIGMPQESFAPLNQYTLPIQNAQIRGWQEMPGSAIIWSDRQDMFRLTGLLSDNTAATAPQLGAQISRLPYNLGCANFYAVDLTPLGAIWMTPQAEIWLYTDKYAPRNIGRPIQSLLNQIPQAQLANVRCRYYHNNTRNWFLVACNLTGQTTNDTLFALDLDLLASNGSPSFFVFDMATNQPTWYQLAIKCSGLEVMYEPTNNVRLLVGSTDLVQDADFNTGFGTEIAVTGATLLTHAWGNDSAAMIKRPTWVRFQTNRDPSLLATDGWSFQVNGIDDDFYTFAAPLTLALTPGVNDSSTLGGNPLLLSGSPFRHSPELFKVGAVNFVMGRRLQFQVNFPSFPGAQYQLRQIQLGFGPSPPR